MTGPARPRARRVPSVRAVAEGALRRRAPRSKAEQRAETLEQILDAAEYLFSVGGLSGVTLRDVAARVGVHTSLLHYYFDDIQQVIDLAMLEHVTAMVTTLREAGLEAAGTRAIPATAEHTASVAVMFGA